MKKAVAFVLCALLAALSFADEAMAFLSEIKSYGTNRSAQLTEEDVLELFRAVATVEPSHVNDGNVLLTWYNVYDISDIQLLNPITMQKDSGYKAVEFLGLGWTGDRYLAFVKKPDILRRIDAMLKTGNTDLVDRFSMQESSSRPEIAEVLWTNGELYKVTWIE